MRSIRSNRVRNKRSKMTQEKVEQNRGERALVRNSGDFETIEFQIMEFSCTLCINFVHNIHVQMPCFKTVRVKIEKNYACQRRKGILSSI